MNSETWQRLDWSDSEGGLVAFGNYGKHTIINDADVWIWGYLHDDDVAEDNIQHGEHHTLQDAKQEAEEWEREEEEREERMENEEVSSVYNAERVEERNRIIATDVGLPLVLATLPDASQEADAIAESLFERHRGAYADDGWIVVFGNDGFAEDHRSRMEVAHVVRVSIDLSLTLDAFGVCREGYTWALVFSCPSGASVETLTSVLHQATCDAWFEASSVPVMGDTMWAVRPLDSPGTAWAGHNWSSDGF